MAKGQARSNKEVKKPKAEKKPAAAVANPFAPKEKPKFGKRDAGSPKK